MAESIKSRANRYSKGDFNKNELLTLAGVLLADKAIDIATFGSLNKLTAKALYRFAVPAVSTTGRIAGTAAMAGIRAAPAIARTVGQATRLVAMRHPYITAAVVTYEAVKHRDQIAQLAREGWEVVEPFVDIAQEELRQRGPPGIRSPVRDWFIEQRKPKRRTSKFNSAIKAGMSAVKKSTSYGGKGKIKPATRVFSMVTKLASAKKKKKKAPKSGIRRKIWNAMKGLR